MSARLSGSRCPTLKVFIFDPMWPVLMWVSITWLVKMTSLWHHAFTNCVLVSLYSIIQKSAVYQLVLNIKLEHSFQLENFFSTWPPAKLNNSSENIFIFTRNMTKCKILESVPSILLVLFSICTAGTDSITFESFRKSFRFIFGIFYSLPRLQRSTICSQNFIAKCCYAIKNPFYPETV